MRPKHQTKGHNSKPGNFDINFSLVDDFPQYFEVQAGSGQFSEAHFQQVSVMGGNVEQCQSQEGGQVPKKQEKSKVQTVDGQFHMDEGISVESIENASSIKTYQFNSGLFAPTKGGKNMQVEDSPPEVEIQMKESFGWNSKYRGNCVGIDQGCYCIAIGCTIVLYPLRKEERCKEKKMYQQHQFEISQLFYSKEYKWLVSGSRGLRPEVVIWSYDGNTKFEECKINFVNRFQLMRKAEGVGLLGLISENILVCIDSISMHRGNSMYLFDIQAGNQVKSAIKISQKVYDIYIRMDKQIYFATEKGICKMEVLGEEKQVKEVGELGEQVVSVCGVGQRVFCGGRDGNVLVLGGDGKVVGKIGVYKSCVYISKIIGKGSLLVTSQTEQYIVTIHRVIYNKSSISLQLLQSIKFTSYCTSIDQLGSGNILLGLRDGSIIMYDIEKRQRKFQKLCGVSYVERQREGMFFFNRINQRFILMAKKAILCQFSPQTSSPECLITKFAKRPRCIWMHKEKIIKIFSRKDGKLKVQINSITDIQGQPEKEIQLGCGQVGKPSIVRFNQDIIAIGTKIGQIIIHCIKTSLNLLSQQKHKSSIEQIIFQEGPFKDGEKYFMKSVCESQLYYWQLQVGQQPKLRKVGKVWSIKNVQWSSICKYGWETRSIWEEMVHYGDICSVALLGDRYLCISMWNGMLRVYRYPASKGNFIECKLFPEKFLVAGCGGKEEHLLGCMSKCCVMVLKFV